MSNAKDRPAATKDPAIVGPYCRIEPLPHSAPKPEEDDPEAIIPTILPMMPVRDVVIFTDMLLPLFVGREKSVNAIEESISKDRYLFVATQIDPSVPSARS